MTTSNLDVTKHCQTLTISHRCPPFIQHLASPKNCGLLLLINQLIGSCSKKQYRLAEKLLGLVPRNSMVIENPALDNAEAFVSQLIEEAKVLASPKTALGELSASAKNLVEVLETCTTLHSCPVNRLEKDWKNFTFHFFKNKLVSQRGLCQN